MSTKTSIKRIALVAVSALGFGLVSVPAFAGETETGAGSVSSISLSPAAASVVAGNAATVTATLVTGTALAGDAANPAKVTLTAFLSSVPDGGGVNITPTRTANNVTVAVRAAGALANVTLDNSSAAARPTIKMVTGNADAVGKSAPAGTYVLGTFAFTPGATKPGNYVLTVWHDQNGDGLVTSGESFATQSITATDPAVAPASQFSNSLGAATTDKVTALALTTSVATARAGVQGSLIPSFKLTSSTTGNGLNPGADGIAAGDGAVTLKYQLAKPSGSLTTLSATTESVLNTVTTGAVSTETAAQSMTAVTFTPDVAGTYTITAYHDSNLNSAIDNGELTASKSYVVAADALVLTPKVWNAKAATGAFGANVRGALVQLNLTNGGVATSLNPGETITVTANGSAKIEWVSTTSYGQTANTTNTFTLGRNNFDSKGRVWLTITDTVAETVVVTMQGAGGTIGSVLQTASIVFADAAGVVDAWTLSNTTGVNEATALVLAGADGDYDVDVLKSTTVGAKVSLTAADAVVAYHILDSSGLITGLANAEWSSYAAGASTAAGTVTISGPAFGGEALAVAGTSAYQISIGATLATDKATITQRASVDKAANTVLDQNSTVRATASGSVTLSAVIKDQYGIVKPNVAVAISVTGRNAQVVTKNTVSDANGRVSITYTDAPLAGVVATTDLVTFDQPNGTDKTVTVNWAPANVDKVTVYTGGNTTAGVANATIVPVDIYAGDGAEMGAVPFSVKVVDTLGNIVVGVPVTFTVDKTGAAFTTSTATSYTQNTGLATGQIYGWLAGTYTVTASAGGKTGTGTITFANTAKGDERTISATASGNVVTALVLDRFGNPVKGVSVYATKTGEGTFGTGVSKVTDTTDANGKVDFSLTNGLATVTVSLLDYNAPAGSNPSGQSCAAKGFVDCAVGSTAATAFTPFTAGTANVDAEGVGASYDAAGISSATVEITATQTSDAVDAANDAVEAANAATDSANAAAEAADAATAAAQDAQAAVADLAAQVATLIAGIKAQITRLTNLVVKIQKKVRA